MNWLTDRFVDCLQERIRLLEAQLNVSSIQVTSRSNQWSPPRSLPVSEQDRDHSAAATLSSLAQVPTPTAPISSILNQSQKDDESNGAARLPTVPPDGPDHETYEWDEGGDEKELGTDAMGAASTRDYKPGFFGIKNPSRQNNSTHLTALKCLLFACRRLIDIILHGRDKSSHQQLRKRLPLGHRNPRNPSTPHPFPPLSKRAHPPKRRRCSRPPAPKNSRPPRRPLLQVRPHPISMAPRTLLPRAIRTTLAGRQR